MTVIPVFAASHGRSRLFAWLGRVLAALALAAAGVWWGDFMHRAGMTYCERNPGCNDIDSLGVEGLVALVLWLVTAIATVFICLGAVLAAPSTYRGRAVWAAMIGFSVFVTHRYNLIWAVIVTCAATCAVLFVSDDLPDRARRRRWARKRGPRSIVES